MKGRKPKPTAAKAIAGTLRPDRANADEPMPTRGIPARPGWLDDIAAAKWDELAPELDRLGLLTIVDGDCLAVYCVAWSEHERATKRLKKEGEITTNRITGVRKAHPCIAIRNAARQTIRQFAALYGLDPSSRSRLHAPAKETGGNDRSEFFAVS